MGKDEPRAAMTRGNRMKGDFSLRKLALFTIESPGPSTKLAGHCMGLHEDSSRPAAGSQDAVQHWRALEPFILDQAKITQHPRPKLTHLGLL